MKKNVFKAILRCIMLFLVFALITPTYVKAESSYRDEQITMLDIPWNLIDQCGSQVSSGNLSACQAYAFAYCRIILDQTSHSWTEYRVGSGQMACAPAAAGYASTTGIDSPSESKILKGIYDSVNAGQPVILRCKGSRLFHYTVAVGYKKSCNPNNLSQSDFIILDPYDGVTKSLTEVPLRTSNGNYGYFPPLSGAATVKNAKLETETGTSTLRIYAENYPENFLSKGSSFPLSGTVSSNYTITSFSGKIVRNDGTIMCSASQIVNAKSLSIRRSKVDMNLKFSSLDDGYYYLVYEATDSSGRTALWQSATFTVGNPEVPHTEHIKGEFVEYGAEHPHMNYYICSVCGEKFTDGETAYVDTCGVCNPTPSETPKIPTTSESPETSATPRGHWSEWSEWSTTAVSVSETRQVEPRQVTTQEARTEYRYGRYVASGHDCWCAAYLEKLPYVSGKATLDYTEWSTTRYSANSKGWSCGNCNGNHIGVDHKTADGRSWWKEFVISGASYYWEESRVVPAQYQTQYRYRDWISE